MKKIISKILLIMASLLVTMPLQAQTPAAEAPSTFNAELQKLAQHLLQGKQGSIVAIEPSTGRVLALASHDKVEDGVNRAISAVYSPGSTFKVAQTLEMVTEGTLTPQTQFACHKGFWKDHIHIGCHKHASPLMLTEALAQSCNSYFCQAFQQMIDNRVVYPDKYQALLTWKKYMQSFGFGRKLGIDMPDEAEGVIPGPALLARNYRAWNGTTIMWIGMGQGEVKATPLQLCNLAAMVANRGWWITPHVHDAAPGQTLDSMFTRHHQSLASAEAIHLVIKGMRGCVAHGTATAINTQRYAICGKTGTAENTGNDHSAFIGFAPMNQPRVAVCVYVENGGFGADLAAPLAALIIEQAVTGKLSEASKARARRWQRKQVLITPVEVPVNFDDL